VINVEKFGLRLIVTVTANREMRSAGSTRDIGKFLPVSIHGEKTIRLKKHQKDQRNDQKVIIRISIRSSDMWQSGLPYPPCCNFLPFRVGPSYHRHDHFNKKIMTLSHC